MQKRLMRRALLIFSIGLLILVGGLGTAWWLQQSPEQRGRVVGEAAIGGPFELVDQRGETVRDSDLQGGYSLLFFGYTYCPDFCPQTLLTVTQALDELEASNPAKAARVTPVFVTVDPERDTVEAMAAYAEHFHERLLALTGSPEQVAEAARAYRVYFRKVEDESMSDYLMDHSTFVFLMGPDGKYLTHFTHATPPGELAAALVERVQG